MEKEVFEIYFRDLTKEAQKKFLSFEEMADEKEGNYDIYPIAVFESTDV